MKPETLLCDQSGTILHYPLWYEDHDCLFNELKADVIWESREVSMFGRQIQIPRLEAWVGERDVSYRYSGKTYTSSGWPGVLLPVIDKVKQELNWNPNSALLNRYRNGSDSVGYHADDEPELGSSPIIAILSLGGKRVLSFKSIRANASTSFKVTLNSGSLLLMQGSTQANWLHAINKVRNADERISCTFRKVITVD